MLFRAKIYCKSLSMSPRVIWLEYQLTLTIHEWDYYRLRALILVVRHPLWTIPLFPRLRVVHYVQNRWQPTKCLRNHRSEYVLNQNHIWIAFCEVSIYSLFHWPYLYKICFYQRWHCSADGRRSSNAEENGDVTFDVRYAKVRISSSIACTCILEYVCTADDANKKSLRKYDVTTHISGF